MPRIVYVNGRYVPHGEAAVHVEDRGLQFADSVYEVCEIRDGRFVDARRHLDRLERSLGELEISMPLAREALFVIMSEIARRNRVQLGLLYLQVTRGVAPRDHPFPHPKVRPGLVVMAWPIRQADLIAKFSTGVSVITVPENRWERVDIKTTSLIANVLAKQAAKRAGAAEAWFVDREGQVTEGSSSNAWIVTADGTLVTRAADRSILRGITREATQQAAEIGAITVEERPFSVEEARNAQEAFLTSASNEVTPIIAVDGAPIGGGKPGPVTAALRKELAKAIEIEPFFLERSDR